MSDADGSRPADARARPVVAVLGGGASGTLVALQLVRAARRAGRTLEVVVVEPAAELGRGLAYGTDDPRHLLNVPAGRMSAIPDDPGHFLRWLHERDRTGVTASDFVPRAWYGRYLADSLEDAVRATRLVRVAHLRTTATDVRSQAGRLHVALADGASRGVDVVVLATGHGRASSRWAPEALRRSPQFLADPWAPQALRRSPEVPELVLVGSGLTMVDVARRYLRPGVRAHVISRHGLLPLPHARDTDAMDAPPAPVATPPLPSRGASRPFAAVRREVFAHLRAVRAAGGDWRAAIDSLRPVTSELWASLDEPARRTFLATAARRWDQARHRIAPEVHDWLAGALATGALVAHTGHVVAARQRADAVEVTSSDGSVVTAGLVVDCTGSRSEIRDGDDTLTRNLQSAGLVRPGPVGLGVATTADGRVATDQVVAPMVWTIGPLRRGELWESTAIPEIRVQALRTATAVLAALPDPRPPGRPRDPHELPLRAGSAAAR